MKFIKFKVTDTQVEILEKSDKIPSGNVEYIKCEFDIDSVFDGLVMRASFNGEYRPIVDNMCYAPVLDTGPCKIGVYGYRIENNQYKLVISPQPTNVIVSEGSYSPEHTQAEIPPPTELEAFYTQIENLIMSNKNNNDYTKLKNIPRRLVYDEDVNFDEKGIFEFMVPLSFTFRGDDSEGNRKEYTVQAEKGAILLSSGNFGNAHNKILITARDIYCEQYRDMEYRFNCLSEMVYDFSTLGTAFSMIYEQLSALSENMDSALSEVNDTVYALSEAFTQQQSKTEQKFKDVNESIDALSESVNQEYLSRVDIEDVRIYTDENGNNKFQFDNATLAVTATGGNSYISDYIPITEKLRITGYAVQNTTMANGIAFVTYDSDKQPIQAYRGDTEISTFVYEKTAVITPEEAAFVRIRSRDNYNSRVKSKATVERFVGAKEKIEEMQAQLDSLLGLTAAAYAAEE